MCHWSLLTVLNFSARPTDSGILMSLRLEGKSDGDIHFCFRQENILFGKFGPIMIKKFGNCQFKGELHSNYVFLFFHLKWPRIRFYNPFYKNELFFSSKTHIFASFAQDTYGDPRGPRTFKDSGT